MTAWLEERVRLGKSGLRTGRLGLGASYFASAKALEEAFEAGCNYFYWGALRMGGMAGAIKNLCGRGKREELIVVVQDFRRTPKGLEKSLVRGLKKARLEYADVLLLGWVKKHPLPSLLEAAEALKRRGLVRCLGASGHNRPLFPELAGDPRFDVFHVRYSAAHRGAEKDIFPHLPVDRPGIVSFTATRRMSLVKSRRIPDEEKRPTAGDCYRFVLSHPSVDVVITAPSKTSHMRENLAEVSKGPMTEEEKTWMRRIGDYVYGKQRNI